MFKISVMYPNKDGATFDVDYYKTKHFAMVKEKLGPMGLTGTAIEKGLAGGAPGEAAPFLCIGHLLFNSLEDFQKAMEAHGEALMADLPNFTNAQPVIQVAEVVE